MTKKSRNNKISEHTNNKVIKLYDEDINISGGYNFSNKNNTKIEQNVIKLYDNDTKINGGNEVIKLFDEEEDNQVNDVDENVEYDNHDDVDYENDENYVDDDAPEFKSLFDLLTSITHVNTSARKMGGVTKKSEMDGATRKSETKKSELDGVTRKSETKKHNNTNIDNYNNTKTKSNKINVHSMTNSEIILLRNGGALLQNNYNSATLQRNNVDRYDSYNINEEEDVDDNVQDTIKNIINTSKSILSI
jgi:hypothetical protein